MLYRAGDVFGIAEKTAAHLAPAHHTRANLCCSPQIFLHALDSHAVYFYYNAMPLSPSETFLPAW